MLNAIQAKRPCEHNVHKVLMPAMGLEPIRGCPQQILSLPRLPFRHAGIFGTPCVPNDLFIIP